MVLDPTNIVFKSSYYMRLNKNIPKEKEEMIFYAEYFLKPDSDIKIFLMQRSVVGEYIFNKINFWANAVIDILVKK